MQHARSRSSRVPEQASWFAADHLLQHLFVKRQIGDYPAQRRILHLKLPQILTSDGIKPPYAPLGRALQRCGNDHHCANSFRTAPLLRPGMIYEKFKATEQTCSFAPTRSSNESQPFEANVPEGYVACVSLDTDIA
jgi:hypothetical protein